MWQGQPFLRIAIPFIAGIGAGSAFAEKLDAYVLLCVCGAVLSLLFFLRKEKDGEHSPWFGIGACLLSFCIGMTLYTRQHQNIESGARLLTTHCQGTLQAKPENKQHSYALRIRQHDGTEVILYVGKSKNHSSDSVSLSSLNIGDTIYAAVSHLNITNKDTSAFQAYNSHLFRNGICATAYVKSNGWRAKRRSADASPQINISELSHSLQETLHHIYDQQGINGDAGAVIEAMTIGRKSSLSQDVRSSYASSGVSHVLAMSGFHIAIILTLLQFILFSKVIPLRWRWTTNMVIIPILWCFTFVAGTPPSLVRASTMCSLLLICHSFTHQLLSVNSIAVTLVFMLCCNPMHILNAGMQLSFISVTAIALMAKELSSLCKVKNMIIQYIWQLIVVSFVCSLATAPLVAYHFGSISLLSIAANLAVTLFVTAIIIGCAAWWATLWLPSVNAPLTDFILWCASTTNAITEQMASLPYSTLHWRPNLPLVFLYYLILLSLIYAIHTSRKNTEKGIRTM